MQFHDKGKHTVFLKYDWSIHTFENLHLILSFFFTFYTWSISSICTFKSRIFTMFLLQTNFYHGVFVEQRNQNEFCTNLRIWENAYRHHRQNKFKLLLILKQAHYMTIRYQLSILTKLRLIWHLVKRTKNEIRIKNAHYS